MNKEVIYQCVGKSQPPDSGYGGRNADASHLAMAVECAVGQCSDGVCGAVVLYRGGDDQRVAIVNVMCVPYRFVATHTDVVLSRVGDGAEEGVALRGDSLEIVCHLGMCGCGQSH